MYMYHESQREKHITCCRVHVEGGQSKERIFEREVEGLLSWIKEELARPGGGGSRQVWADIPGIEQRPRSETLHGISLRSKGVLLGLGLKHKAENKEFMYCYLLIC